MQFFFKGTVIFIKPQVPMPMYILTVGIIHTITKGYYFRRKQTKNQIRDN